MTTSHLAQQQKARRSMWDMPLTDANWWYVVSWYGGLASSAVAALAACLGVAFAFVQFRSSGIREDYAAREQLTLKVETARAMESAAAANAQTETLRNANLRLAAATAPQSYER